MPKGIYRRKPFSKEHRAKISENSARYWLGKKLSEGIRKKMSISHKGQNMGELHPRWKGGVSLTIKKTSWERYILKEKKIIDRRLKTSAYWMRKWRLVNPDKAIFLRHIYKMQKRDAQGLHTFEAWQELKAFYNFMCLCCKKFEPEIKLTEDHIVPLSMGGRDTIDNIQPLCQSCNTRKHIKTIDYRPLSIDSNLEEKGLVR